MNEWQKRYKELKIPYVPSTKQIKLEHNHDSLIKLNYNESNFGPSPKVLNYNYKVKEPHRYPDYHSEDLIKQLMKLYKLQNDNFWIANGSDAILDWIPALFSTIKKNENIIIPELTYGRILQTSIVQHIDTQKIPLKNGFIDLDLTLEKINKNTSIIYIVNPNMPTGTSYSYKKIDEFISKVPKNILVIIDQAYVEFSIGVQKSFEFAHDLIKKYNNILITRTFSKIFAIAAYRIGYMVASKSIVSLFQKAVQVFPLTNISAQYACVALSDINYYENIYKVNCEEKEKYYSFFESVNLEYYKSDTNFIYIITKNEKWKNAELRLYLLKKHHILIRNILTIGLRITVGTPDENILVRKAIQEFIDAQ